MAHDGARPCPDAAGLALVVAVTLKHLHVVEKTKHELREEEGNGAVPTTMRSPARPRRLWRGGVWSRQGCLPRVRKTHVDEIRGRLAEHRARGCWARRGGKRLQP